MNYIFLLSLILFFGCSTGPIKDQSEYYSKVSVLDLARQSYIRGCIEGQNLIDKKLTKGKRLNSCKIKSENHITDLEKILK